MLTMHLYLTVFGTIKVCAFNIHETKKMHFDRLQTPQKAFLSYSGVQFSLHIIAKSQMFLKTHMRKR